MHWAAVGETAGGLATFTALILVPAALVFHRRVIRPLRQVMGVSKDANPTGEDIPPLPEQVAAIRHELSSNGGKSVKDRVQKTHKLAKKTNKALQRHLVESEQNEKAIWRAIGELKR